MTHTRTMCRLMAALILTLLWGTNASAQILIRQPYLQSGSSEQMVVVWRTFPDTGSVLRWGTSPDNLDQEFRDPAQRSHHEVRLTNLSPATRYYYSVGTPDQTLATGDSYYFETAPVPGTAVPFRAWVVGDSGTGGLLQGAVRDAMLNHVGADRPDLFLHVGDMAYSDGEELEFDLKFYAQYTDILRNTVCWPALGNHEGRSSDSGAQSGPYYEGYVLPTAGQAGGLASGTEAYYSFDYANAHFVVLDSHDSPRDTDGAMMRWLRMDLENTSATWLIAYWHHPPYSKGSHDSDSEGQLIEMRRNALPILEAAGVDLVFAGHSHIYERTFLLNGAYGTPSNDLTKIVDDGNGRANGDGSYRKTNAPNQGAVYVVAGHGGAGTSQSGVHPLMFIQEPQNGSVILDIEGNSATLTNVRVDGVVSDWFTLVKGPAITLISPADGATIQAGISHEIQWSSHQISGDVRIEFRVEQGQWEILSETENNGRWVWETPRFESASAQIRITSVEQPQYADESGAFTLSRRVQRNVIAIGDIWSYHDQPEDPGSNWAVPEYDDSTWASAPGQFGYGEGDERTSLRNENPNIASVYFRKSIQLDDPVVEATIQVLHDDGAGVWINGTFMWSIYLEDGVGHSTYASSGSSDNELTAFSPNLNQENPFVVGENVIAVMVKQANESSSDVSFDLSMDLTLLPNAQPAFIDLNDVAVVVGQTVRFTVSAEDPDEDPLTYNATTLPGGSTWAPGSRQFEWTVSEGDIGIHSAVFTVSDGRYTVDGTVQVEVSANGTGEDAGPGTDTTPGTDAGPGTDTAPGTDTNMPGNPVTTTETTCGCWSLTQPGNTLLPWLVRR